MGAEPRFARNYARKAEVRRFLTTARECGLDVAGFEVSPDGSIRILEARAMPEQAMDEFDRLEAEGRL